MNNNSFNRRRFLASSLAISATALIGFKPNQHSPTYFPSDENNLMVIGPVEGYTPQIGTLVSMLNYNRFTVINAVKNLTVSQLDHLHDEKSNTIGALIMHLGATEKFYQINTFEGRQEYNEAEKKIWQSAMELGDAGRKDIKGKEVNYYLNLINEVRRQTLEELKKKDDSWLLALDPVWSKRRPVNNYWKWFHVCEHESNHRGQISWYKGRLPGIKAGNE